jgi:hypothetical protein
MKQYSGLRWRPVSWEVENETDRRWIQEVRSEGLVTSWLWKAERGDHRLLQSEWPPDGWWSIYCESWVGGEKAQFFFSPRIQLWTCCIWGARDVPEGTSGVDYMKLNGKWYLVPAYRWSVKLHGADHPGNVGSMEEEDTCNWPLVAMRMIM